MTFYRTNASREHVFDICTPHLGALGRAGAPVPGRRLKGLVSRFDPGVLGPSSTLDWIHGAKNLGKTHRFTPGKTKGTDEPLSITSQPEECINDFDTIACTDNV